MNAAIRNVVLELCLIVDVVDEEIPDWRADLKIERRNRTSVYVYMREGATPMVSWLAQNCCLSCWTYLTRPTARLITNKLFPGTFDSLLTRRDCTVFSDTYVKDLSRFKSPALLIDINDIQIAYNVEYGVSHTVLVDTDANLRRMLRVSKRILSRRAVTIGRRRVPSVGV